MVISEFPWVLCVELPFFSSLTDNSPLLEEGSAVKCTAICTLHCGDHQRVLMCSSLHTFADATTTTTNPFWNSVAAALALDGELLEMMQFL